MQDNVQGCKFLQFIEYNGENSYLHYLTIKRDKFPHQPIMMENYFIFLFFAASF